jgi:hypothetical protein
MYINIYMNKDDIFISLNLIHNCKICDVKIKLKNLKQHINGKRHMEYINYYNKFKIIKQNDI